MAISKTVGGWIVGLIPILVAGMATAGERRGAPSTETATATTTIDKFCEGLVPITKIDDRRRLFGLFAKNPHDRGRWVEYRFQTDLDAAVKAGHVYDVAQAWSRQDGAIAVSISLSNPSGDWVQYVEYCFRSDGTLARTESTLNTFNAVSKNEFKDVHGASRQRNRYFDNGGKQLKVTKRLLDLKTNRPDPTLQFMDADEPIYKTTAALPFYSVMKGRSAAQPGVER